MFGSLHLDEEDFFSSLDDIPLMKDQTVCEKCLETPEACVYCRGIADEDWAAICDCGLFDFGTHLPGACNLSLTTSEDYA